MKRIFLSLLIVLLLVSSVFAASKEQAPKAGFVVKNGQWQRQSEGNDVGDPIEFVPRHEDGMDFYGDYFLNGMVKAKGSAVFWLAVQPGNDVPGEYEFGPRGLHFYSEETKKYSFLPIEEIKDAETSIFSVEFSGDGQFIINFYPSFALFTFPDLKCVFKIEDESTASATWVDGKRFVFYKWDINPDRHSYEGSSVYLFDTLTGETPVLKKATKNSSFFTGIHDPGYISGREKEVLVEGSKNVINVTEIFVKSEKDWEDEEKIKSREIRVEIPEAR